MDRSSTILTVLIFLCTTVVYAQLPPRCGNATDEPPGCFMCSPVYVGSNAGMTPGSTPGNFCGVIHNNAWISFQACAPSISFSMVPSNCTNGEGLQVVVVDQNLQPVSNCCTPPPNMISCNLTATGLTPGDLYYVMIDGSTGDVCDFVLTATSGFCFGPPDPLGSVTVDPNSSPYCPGTVVTYSVAPVNNTTNYEWTVPGGATILSGQGTTEITVVYNTPTAGVVCVTPQNPCYNGNPVCVPVLVRELLPTILPPETFCAEEYPMEIDGNTFPRPGTYSVTYQTNSGCDSLVTYTLLQHPRRLRIENETICSDDCYLINSQYYCEAGNYRVVLEDADQYGCDSIINLRLQVLTPVSEIADPPDLACDPNATLELDASASSSNAQYNWSTENGGNIISGINTLTPTINRPGRYILAVTVTNGAGLFCTALDTVDVARAVLPLDTIRFVAAPLSVCDSSLATYTILPVPTATEYTWVVTPGAIVSGSGTSITVDWDTLKVGRICVQASNFCGLSPDTCIDVRVVPNPSAAFTVASPVCVGDSAELVFTGTASDSAIYNWNLNGGQPDSITGPGPHQIVWNTSGIKNITLTVNDDACETDPVRQEVEVVAPFIAPVINCNSSYDAINFFWDDVPGATSYDLSINGGTPFSQTDNSYLVENLNPNETVHISVTVNGNAICGPVTATQSCQAQNCAPIALIIDSVGTICRDVNAGTLQLTYIRLGGGGSGTAVWAGDAVSPTGIFDPAQANLGANTIVLTYTEASCDYIEAMTINVFESPAPTFTIQSPICIDTFTTAQYTGSGSASADYQWNFDNGNILNNGVNAGPYEIDWDTPGDKSVSLSVQENGCSTPPQVHTVRVDTPLQSPLITCSATTSQITFSWLPVPGADDYSVNILKGKSGRQNGLSYQIDSLNPVDTLWIQLVANGDNACGPTIAEAQCVTAACPAIQISIDTIASICKNNANAIIRLSANAIGGNGSGTWTWSGPGVSPDGLFDPDAPSVNAPSVNIRAIYTQDNCTADTTITVPVLEQPDAAIQTDNIICRTDTAEVFYIGSAGTGAVYQWHFDNAVVVNNAAGPGPYRVYWDNAGTKNLSLVVTENDCISDTAYFQVQVDNPLPKPVLRCIPNPDNVAFEWNDIPGATNYLTNVLSGQAGQRTTNSYTVAGLNPGDEVSLELIAQGPTICGPSRDTLVCEAKVCPDVLVFIRAIEDVCLYANLSTINLNDSLDITGAAAPDISWEGEPGTNYIGPNGKFFPYNAAFGDNLITVTVIEDGCTFSATTNIVVYPIPLAGISLPNQTCIDAPVSVNATYLSSTATYDWSSGRADILSGNGAGPITMLWQTPGVDTVSLVVTENGCISEQVNAIINVKRPLPLPAINCDVTNTSILFSWNAIAGANEYILTVEEQPAGALMNRPDDLSAVFNNLMQNDSVTISLTVADTTSPCMPVTISETCFAKECPDILLEIEAVQDSCFKNNFSQQLVAVAQGSDGTGSGIWRGDYVDVNGVFSPPQPGNYTVTYEFIEQSCPFTISKEIFIYETPIATFFAPAAICLTDPATLTYTGHPIPGAIYNWNFENGNPPAGSGVGPHTVRWSQGGTHRAALSVHANGCVSDTVTRVIRTDEPLLLPQVNCSATTSSVELCWHPDPFGDSYEVSVLSGQSGTRNGNCITVHNLDPLTQVDFQIKTNNRGACPDTAIVVSCTTEDCPEVELVFSPVENICLTADVLPQNLSDSLRVISNGTGQLIWGGPGMEAGTGIFNPQLAGAGQHLIQVTYIEDGCRYSTQTTINIYQPPIVDAGIDQVINCYDTLAAIGGAQDANNCTCTQYTWTGGSVTHPALPATFTTQPGTYTLSAYDPSTGCVAQDEVVVTARQNTPNIDAALDNITCFGRRDGQIVVNGISGGTAPYAISMNGGNFTMQRNFEHLGPGLYQLVVRDANGCKDSISFEISEPRELIVELVIHAGEGPIIQGQEIQLEAVIQNYAPNLLTDIQWSPADEFPECDEVNITNCLSYFVTPTGTTVYTVRVENINGCVDTDNRRVDVKRIRPVYIPSAFSPFNQDNINDIFLIYGGPQVVRVKTFLVFDRWGETIHAYRNFHPSDVAHGWDGTFKGQKLNTGVYVYYAEIEFEDGVVEIFKGDVTLR